MLAGACDALKDEGCVLVGGHSAESPELAFGLCVSSIVAKTQIRRKGGMKPGLKVLFFGPLFLFSYTATGS